MSFLQHRFTIGTTPQTQRSRDDEVVNAAGGYVFAIDDWERLDRFLIIGTQGGTYYVGQQKLTEENAKIVQGLLDNDAKRVIERVTTISHEGRALKQDYGLYVLALAACHTDPQVRKLAYAAVPDVCRTASTLFQFVSYLKGRRGWSRGLRAAVAQWYLRMPARNLVYQMTKYRQRHNITHKLLLRLAHPQPQSGDYDRNYAMRWATDHLADTKLHLDDKSSPLLLISAMDHIASVLPERRGDFVRDFRLVREHVPTEWLDDINVQRALFAGMPMWAMLRNLGVLTKIGVLTGDSQESLEVVRRFSNQEAITESRLHPIAIYLAMVVYKSGHGVKGSESWAPVNKIIDALNVAFQLSFGNVRPTDRNICIGLDVSGSMADRNANVMGLPIKAADACAAMATVHAHVERNNIPMFVAFDTQTYPFKAASDVTIERMREIVNKGGGGTDCALPIQLAQGAFGPAFDAFIIYTDSETWAGNRHVQQAMEQYRADRNRNAKLVVASATATGTSIGDPKDRNTLQVCGFDASVPNVIADFIRGEL